MDTLTSFTPPQSTTSFAVWTIITGLVVFLLVKLFMGYRKLSRNFNRILERFPSPEGHWIFGNILQFPGPGEKGLAYLREKVAKWPRGWTFQTLPLRPRIEVTHPDQLKVVLASTEPKQTEPGGAYMVLLPWLGNGLLVASGPKWRRNRKLLTPAFHFQVLKPYMKIYNEAADKLIAKWDLAIKTEKSIEVYIPISLCTLNVILRCAFSSEIDVQAEGTKNPYVNAVLEISKIIVKRFLSPALVPPPLFYVSSYGRQFRRLCKFAHTTSGNVIKERQKTLKDTPEAARARHHDFLDILLLARDDNGDGLTNQEIRDEVDTFLFEGHDTTASAISWILYTLAENPEHQERCREEIDKLVQGRETNDVEWDDLTKLPHTTRCIKEALRIHSPVPYIGRQVSDKFRLDGVTIRKGIMLDIVIYAIHHNPAVWGEDHMEFKPERFEFDNIRKMDSHAFIPFSAGPRNCIGQNFAMNEIKVIVSRVLHRFKLAVDPDHPAEHVIEVVMRTTNGMRLILIPRD